jgi:hypothetical protein
MEPLDSRVGATSWLARSCTSPSISRHPRPGIGGRAHHGSPPSDGRLTAAKHLPFVSSVLSRELSAIKRRSGDHREFVESVCRRVRRPWCGPTTRGRLRQPEWLAYSSFVPQRVCAACGRAAAASPLGDKLPTSLRTSEDSRCSLIARGMPASRDSLRRRCSMVRALAIVHVLNTGCHPGCSGVTSLSLIHHDDSLVDAIYPPFGAELVDAIHPPFGAEVATRPRGSSTTTPINELAPQPYDCGARVRLNPRVPARGCEHREPKVLPRTSDGVAHVAAAHAV